MIITAILGLVAAFGLFCGSASAQGYLFNRQDVVVATPLVGGTPSSIAFADFNGDGKPDLAVSEGAGVTFVAVVLGKGDGTFGPFVTYEAAKSLFDAGSILAADFNGDGKLDLAVVGSNCCATCSHRSGEHGN